MKSGGLLLLSTLALVLATVGCERKEIHSYRVPKEVEQPDEPAMQGMPMASQPAAPAQGGSKVLWTLPPDWKEVPTTQAMRLATFDAFGAEVSVSAFPGDVGGTLANVNRWRGQIGLPPATEADLPALLTTTKDNGVEVSILTMTGDKGQVMLASMITPGDGQTWFVKAVSEPAKIEQLRPSFEAFSKSFRLGSGSAPSMSAPPPAPMPSAPMPGTGSAPAGGSIGARLDAWTPPSNWKKEQVTVQFLTASFQADNAEGGAKATVASLMGDAGGLLPNINRWRGQLELAPVADLSQQQSSTFGSGSMLVDLTNASGSDRMIVAVVPTPAETWFFKLRGQPAGVEAEKASFEKMVKAVGLGVNP